MVIIEFNCEKKWWRLNGFVIKDGEHLSGLTFNN